MDALFNWLWQGCVVALATTGVLHARVRMSAAARYTLWWLTLVLVLALPLANVPLPAAISAPMQTLTPVATIPLDAMPRAFVAVSLGAWALWVGAGLWRMYRGILWLHRIKRTCSPLSRAREARLERWTALRLRGRRARLAVSRDVHSAAVIGLGSPVIALAPHLLDTLDDADLDRTVLHEWAHVQRRDDVALFLELLVRTVAGLHPAIWWTLRQLRLERELACDDRAVRESGSAVAYAALLARLADVATPSASASLAPAAAPANLAPRITRLLDPRRGSWKRGSRITVALASPAIVLVGLTVAPLQLVVNAQPSSFAAPSYLTARAVTAFAAWPGMPGVFRLSPSAFLDEPARVVTAVLPSGRARTVTAAPASASQFALDHAIHSSESDAVPSGSRELLETSALNAFETLSTLDTHVTQVTMVAYQLAVRTASPVAVASGQSPGAKPWDAAAQASIAIGHESQRAAVATAAIFTKLSRKIAGSF